MSGQKIGLTAGRSLAAARGIPAAGDSPGLHPETAQDSSMPETPQTEESKKTTDKRDMGNDGNSLQLVDESKFVNGKSDGGKSASGGGDGGDGDPGNNPTPTPQNVSWYRRKGFVGAAVGTAIGAGAAVVAAPIVIGAMGFGAGGIIAGSYAAQMMSAAALANGGGVVAGGLVATLQSIGAAGFSIAGLFGVGAAGAGVGAAVGGGVGTVADLATGNRSETVQEAGEPQGRAEEGGMGVATSEDVSVPNLSVDAVDETQCQPEELLSIIVSESDGNIRRFSIMSSEPLQRMFDEYFDQTGLARDSVRFEFNGLTLDGLVSPEELCIESDDVVKALRI